MRRPQNKVVDALRFIGKVRHQIAEGLKDTLQDSLSKEYEQMDNRLAASKAYFEKYGHLPLDERPKTAKQKKYETLLADMQKHGLSAEECNEMIKKFHEENEQ